MKNYYAVLGVVPDADYDVIAAAHKALAKKLHPDGKRGDERSRCEARLKEVNEAWAVLRDREKRRQYDEQRQRQQEPFDREVAGKISDLLGRGRDLLGRGIEAAKNSQGRLGRGIEAAQKGQEFFEAVERIFGSK